MAAAGPRDSKPYDEKRGERMAYAEKCGKKWRVRYKKPNGIWASEPGFDTKSAALDWGREQEGEIRRHTWIDPADAKTPFGEFVEQWLTAARLAINTEAKYKSYLKKHILPRWEDWPLVLIFNGHLEIQGWVNELHDELAEPTVASIFALFSTIMNAAVRARKIPVSPCHGIRVTTGDYETERQVATPVEFLRAALRMHDLMGYQGFVLTLMNGYTGARWSELISQKPNQYDEVNRQIPVRRPIREAGGQIEEAPRPKSPASKRWIQLRRSSPSCTRRCWPTAATAGRSRAPAGRCYGVATSPAGSGGPPGTEIRTTVTRTSEPLRCWTALPSTKDGTSIAPGCPTTVSPTSAARPGSATSCQAWPTSTNTSHPR
jgi:hypothetical protein